MDRLYGSNFGQMKGIDDEDDGIEGIHVTKVQTNQFSKSPSQRLSSRSEGPPRLPERLSSRLPLTPVK